MPKINPVEDEQALRASEEIIQLINNGEIDLSKYLIGIAIEQDCAQKVFYEYLEECVVDEVEPEEFIQKTVGIVCSKERLERILRREEKIEFSEVSNWLSILYNDGNYSGLNEYFLIPTSLLGYSDYYVIVQRDGVELDPEYNLIATFASEGEAKRYYFEKYDF